MSATGQFLLAIDSRSLLFRAGGDRECPERLKPSGIEYLSGVCWRTGS